MTTRHMSAISLPICAKSTSRELNTFTAASTLQSFVVSVSRTCTTLKPASLWTCTRSRKCASYSNKTTRPTRGNWADAKTAALTATSFTRNQKLRRLDHSKSPTPKNVAPDTKPFLDTQPSKTLQWPKQEQTFSTSPNDTPTSRRMVRSQGDRSWSSIQTSSTVRESHHKIKYWQRNITKCSWMQARSRSLTNHLVMDWRDLRLKERRASVKMKMRTEKMKMTVLTVIWRTVTWTLLKSKNLKETCSWWVTVATENLKRITMRTWLAKLPLPKPC